MHLREMVGQESFLSCRTPTPTTLSATSTMLSAAKKRTAPHVSQVARRTLVNSPRLLSIPQEPIKKPVTSQPVKNEINKVHVTPMGARVATEAVNDAVKKKVHENNANSKNKSPIFGFLLKAIFLSSLVYGGTMFVASKNERVMDFVIDYDLPYHDEIINVIENGSFDDLKKTWQTLSSKLSKEEIKEFSQTIEHKGEQLVEETKKKFGVEQILPGEQLQKPVEFEASSKFDRIPSVSLTGGSGICDSSVQATIDSFNDLLGLLDGSNLGRNKSALVKKISDNITALSTKLATLSESFEQELQKKLKESEVKLLTVHTKKELDLTQSMLDQFNVEKANLEKKYQERIAIEVDAVKRAISQAAVNATTMVRIEQTKQFESSIKELVDEERNGRLKNLDAINSRLEKLESIAIDMEKQVSATGSKSSIKQAVSNLRSLLFNTSETAAAKNFKPYVEKLQLSTTKSNDEVIALAVEELKPLLNKESSQSILTTPQLLSAWEQLTPELRSASLLPPNAGLLGHLASIFFSKLLMPVKGAKPDGRDIESVIGRVQQSLSRGELDTAVEEVANLKGWTRQLADDWVREGRKRLEAEFLVDLIEAETKLL